MLQVLVPISLKFHCKKEAWSYAKVMHKKEKKRVETKNGHKSVQDIENNGYLDACLKKKKER
jgi:hypothetical protein